MSFWWVREPERYEFELNELRKMGVEYTVDKELYETGKLVIELMCELNGEATRLVVKFPDFYPYLRFEIYAPELELQRHQNPFEKNLCLLGRSTSNWHTTDTVASFLKTRLPEFLNVVRSLDPDYVAEKEEHQGEPITDYYPYIPNTSIVVGAWKLDEKIRCGSFKLGLESKTPLRGCIIDIKDDAKRVMVEAEQSLAKRYKKVIAGRWIRVSAPIIENDPTKVLEILVRLDKDLAKPIFSSGPDVIGIVFPEESQWRTEQDGWLFVVREKITKSLGGKRKRKQTGIRSSFARATYGSRKDLDARIPELSTLKNKIIAIFGLGSIGSPSAVELAKSGVGEIRMLDYDIVEYGTTVRWALGFPAAGKKKTQMLEDYIVEHYPHTVIKSFDHRLGDVIAQYSEIDLLDEFLDGVDLIYDATAEIGISNLVSHLASKRSIPYVWTSTTHGAWGGIVGRIRPNKTEGCIHCYYHMLTDGTITVPNQSPTETVQPTGCSDPTFTGAGFDISNIVLAGVRLAVSTLCNNADGQYPDFQWDVAVVNLRDKEGNPILPVWEPHVLCIHKECENEEHGSKDLDIKKESEQTDDGSKQEVPV